MRPVLNRGAAARRRDVYSRRSTRVVGAIVVAAWAVCATANGARIEPGPGRYTFAGVSTLTGLGQTLRCTLTLTGTVARNSRGGVTVTVTRGRASGDFASGCNLVGFVFPWRATVADSAIPRGPTRAFTIVFKHVVVKAAGIDCSAHPVAVSARFYNGDPISKASTLAVDAPIGRCSVAGVFRAKTDVNIMR